jgi:acyl-coenzyme A thioesterase PaaI-like protein
VLSAAAVALRPEAERVKTGAMRESFASRLLRWKTNFFPAYRGTGGRVTFIAADFKEIRVEVPLNWRTRNYVGTIFGGSLYGAVDPIYMVMLIRVLGPGYVVWDKAATIRFRKPGRATLYARFLLGEEEIETIRRLAAQAPSIDRVYTIDLVDRDGIVYATVEKTIYIRKKKPSDAVSPAAPADDTLTSTPKEPS